MLELALAVYALVKPVAWASRSVHEGIAGAAWTRDLRGSLSIDAIMQFLDVWPLIAVQQLSDGPDRWRWVWSTAGEHTAKSTYLATFAGRINCGWKHLVWTPWAPLVFLSGLCCATDVGPLIAWQDGTCLIGRHAPFDASPMKPSATCCCSACTHARSGCACSSGSVVLSLSRPHMMTFSTGGMAFNPLCTRSFAKG